METSPLATARLSSLFRRCIHCFVHCSEDIKDLLVVFSEINASVYSHITDNVAPYTGVWTLRESACYSQLRLTGAHEILHYSMER